MPWVYCPRTVTIGQEIPLLLAVDKIRNPVWNGYHHNSQLSMEDFSLGTTAHTRTIMQNRPHKRRCGRCLELSYAVFQASGLHALVNIDGFPIPIVRNFKILPGTIPSFHTYTLSHSYSIDLFFKFNFDGESLEWCASIDLKLAADDAMPLAAGSHVDPLLFMDPTGEPPCFLHAHINAGAADSTSRSDIYPDNPGDAMNLPGLQWQTTYTRLPRTSYACANGQISPELIRPKASRLDAGAFKLVSSLCGKPRRRYLKDLEPMVASEFGHKDELGLDGFIDIG